MSDCTHNLKLGKPGLCRRCQRDYDEDPQAWWEFGCHPEGERRWRELYEEIAADAARAQDPTPPDWSDWGHGAEAEIPF